MVAIITQNAIHGGVETIIEMHARLLGAPVFVAGGLDNPYGTCPFEYTRTDTPEALTKALIGTDAIIYHWLPRWATYAIKATGIPAIEYIHRIDTADGDRSVPKLTIAHSQHLVDFIQNTTGNEAVLAPYPIEVDGYPQTKGGPRVGGITSYYPIKGIEKIIEAWGKVGECSKEWLLTFYGAGPYVPEYQVTAAQAGIGVHLLGPAQDPKTAWEEYRLAISASRIEGGTPLAILEALACGVPAIVPKLPGCLELAQKARQRRVTLPLYFHDGTPEDIAMLINIALRNDIESGQTQAAMRALFPPGIHIEWLKYAIEEVQGWAKKTS